MKILLLGGTSEARELAGQLHGRDVLYALAGVTENPQTVDLPTRIGGFGGAEGLARFLKENGYTHLVDATHPFAAQMHRHAAMAAASAGIGAIHLLRPAWGDGAGVVEHATDMQQAAAMIDGGRRVFLALGTRHLELFRHREDIHFVVRTIDHQPDRQPFTFTTGIPPFAVEAETATFLEHRIDTLVLRDSGGSGGLSKLAAARQLGLRIIMIDRPPAPAGLVVETVAEVLDWLGREEAKWSAAS